MFPQWIAPVIAFYCPTISQPGVGLPPPTTEQLQLVQKLSSEKFQEREEVQSKLEKMDIEIYKALLEGATNNPDAEVRQRCIQIMTKVIRYNIPKNSKDLPTLFGSYGLNIMLSSGKEFCINKEVFLKYFCLAIEKSDDTWKKGGRSSFNGMTYLLPMASHYLFQDMRLMGYSREDIDEIIKAMNKNIKKMYDNKSYDHYQWLN